MAYFTRTHGDSLPVFALDQQAGPGAVTGYGHPVNPAGPELDFFKVLVKDGSASAVALTGEEGTLGAVEAILRAVEQLATVHMYQIDSTNQISLAVYPASAWTTTTLATAITSLGSSVGAGPVDVSGTTVATAGFKLA